jgi:hypothetical protein
MSAHLPTMPPRPSGDITITATHREVMRRLDQGESLTEEHVDTLGALYLHELVEDAPTPALTPLGRRVLDVGGVLTTRQERPRLVSMPIPKGWRPWDCAPKRCISIGLIDRVIVLSRDECDEELAATESLGRALIAGVEWVRHEKAVRAQDGGS